VTLVLFRQPLAQGLHQLLPAAQGLDPRLLLLAQVALQLLAQPVFRDRGRVVAEQLLDALEVRPNTRSKRS